MLEWDCTLTAGGQFGFCFPCFCLLSLLTSLPPCPPPNPSICSCPSLLSNRAGSVGGSTPLTPCSVPLLGTTLPIAPNTWAHVYVWQAHQWTSGEWKIEQKSITVRSRKYWREIRSDWQGKVPNMEPSRFEIGDCVCSNTLIGSRAIISFMRLFIEKLNTEKPTKNSHLSLSEIRLKPIDHVKSCFPSNRLVILAPAKIESDSSCRSLLCQIGSKCFWLKILRCRKDFMKKRKRPYHCSPH